jgi:hypothetical protein
MPVPYPEDYFAIQLIFAHRMAALAQVSPRAALLEHTSLYKLLGVPGDFDATQPVWRDLLACVDERAEAGEQARAIYRFYLNHLPSIPNATEERHWRCFAYQWRPALGAIRIHFSNEDAPEPGALSHQRFAARLAELRAMFAVARAEWPDAEQVIGRSWLYNLASYRRLFPPAFGASAMPVEPELQYRARWDQFLLSDGSLHRAHADDFLARLAALTDPACCADCFPFQVMHAHAAVGAFYAFYDV